MLRQDKVIAGVITGVVFPLMIFIIMWEFNGLMVHYNWLPGEGFRLQFLCIISVVANVLPAGMYVRAKKDQALKGIAGITLLYVFGIIVFFYKGLTAG